MERLTKKINDYWATNNKARIYYLDKNESFFIGNAIDKLAEFEDFMEENGFENLKELKELLSANYKLTNAVSDLDKDFICECLLEYPEIKNRWNKLKQYINNQQPLVGNNISFLKETLLQKIQELENLKLGD